MTEFQLEPGDTGQALLPTEPLHPCGHWAREKGCGGCDPGAVEFVRDDGGPWRRLVHNHDLDPTCRETRNAYGRMVGECMTAAVPVSAIAERAKRYSQCDDTCTTDCGHCKGAGAPKVNGRDAWLPEGDEPVFGDVRHHRERIDQLKEWVAYWSAKAHVAEAKVARATETLDAHGQWYSGPLLYRALCEALDVEVKP